MSDTTVEPNDHDHEPDREIEAITKCVRILLTLDPAQSAGVVRYLADRFTIGDLRS